MVSKFNYLLQALNEKSQEEPLVLVVAALGVISVLCFLFLVAVIVVKVLGILFIPVVSVIWSVVMVIIDYRRGEGE